MTDYESLIPEIELPDPGDRHVLAAAIRSQASVIVTFNLSDFPTQALAPYNVKAQHPDEFIHQLIELNSAAVCSAAQSQQRTLKNPLKTPDEYLNTLLEQGLMLTVATIRELCEEI